MTAPLTPADLAALLAQAAGIDPARARAILAASPLASLVRESPESLSTLHNLTPKQARGLYAGLTLGRMTCGGIEERSRYNTPRGLAEYLIPLYGHVPVEQFGVVALTTKHTTIGIRLIGQGSLDTCVVHPREVFRAALELRAASLIAFHNHPSGDPTPSPDDLTLTQRLIGAGEIMGIPVLDHLILTEGRYYSFMEAGRVQR